MTRAPGLIDGGLTIRGEIAGQHDLVLEGRVDGRIALDQHNLIVEARGVLDGEARAATITVFGRVSGRLDGDRIELRSSARVNADIRALTLIIEDGADFSGDVQMVLDLPEEM